MKNSGLKILDHKNSDWTLLTGFIIFILVWAYIIVRANTIFLVHDEIATKWAYMVSWNPLPYQGYVDANNHFLNSLLGGLFIRLFQSDAGWIVRLPNILAFPLYFWAVFGFRKFFSHRVNFFLLLVVLMFSACITDYFGIARGYGMSMALLILALWQTALFLTHQQPKHFIIALAAWALAVYANLTLIPFALAGIVYLTVYAWSYLNKARLSVSLGAVILVGYAIKYAFHLKAIGKLYYGNKEGFFHTTVHSLTNQLLNSEGIAIDVIMTAMAMLIIFTTIYAFSKARTVFLSQMLFPLFFLLGIANILGQHWLLGVNYPEDRAALYLVVFFLGAICFTLDYWKEKRMAYPLIAGALLIFGFQLNLATSITYPTQHYDEKLLTSIPDRVHGIPPATGSRYWFMDNEMTRKKELPLRAFQKSDQSSDTLVDYLITWREIRPDILNWYHPIYKDSISDIILFERDRFLDREKLNEKSQTIKGSKQYFGIYSDTLTQPLFIRCSGKLENIDIFKQAIMVFSTDDFKKNKDYSYVSVPLVKSAPIRDNGNLTFDFTVAINDYSPTDQLKVYLWNKEKSPMKGKIEVAWYKIL